jgi:hypothetical protein
MQITPRDFIKNAPRAAVEAWYARKGLAHRRVRNRFANLTGEVPRPGPGAGVKRWARYLRRS